MKRLPREMFEQAAEHLREHRPPVDDDRYELWFDVRTAVVDNFRGYWNFHEKTFMDWTDA